MIVYDLDGTLFNTPGREEAKRLGIYLDPAALHEYVSPHPAACRYVRALHDDGLTPLVAYLTGRPEVLREATEVQIHQAGLPDGELAMLDAWDGWTAHIDHKARVLDELDAIFYVGDLGADKVAATEAGVGFIWASDFRRLATLAMRGR